MANLSSTRKAVRQSARRAVFNLRVKRAMKKSIKTLRELITAKDAKSATDLLPQVYKAIDKAVKRGVIKKNNASRKKSRLTKAIYKITTNK